MKLTDFASQSGTKDHFVKASFGGFAGSGKTRTASEFIKGIYKDLKLKKPLLFIDNEKGGRFLVPEFEKQGVKVLWKQTIKLADILQAFEFLNAGEVDCLFIDSLSKVWYDYVADYKKKNGNKTFMTLQDWGKILPAWQKEFSDRFVDLNGSCIFTGRGGYTYDMEENEDGKKEFTKSGVKMKMAGETPFEPDLNIWMDIDQTMKDGHPSICRTALVMKDRSALIDGKTFVNPTYGDFKPVVDFLLGLKTGNVAGITNDNNIAPVENKAWYEEKEAKEIRVAEIKATFEKYGFSGPMGKELKSLFVKIFEKVFDVKTLELADKKYNSFQLKRRGEILEIALKDISQYSEIGEKESALKNIDVNELLLIENETQMTLSNGR